MNLGPIASPFAALFRAGVCLRRWAYDRGWLGVARAPVFTVSVGGLEVGGSGKTPVTEKLLEAFARAGREAALLTRGYGRHTRGLVLRERGTPARPEVIGDEPAMLVGLGLDVRVAASEKRSRGMAALAALGVDTVVMDDAFSHRAQARHVDIVVLRGEEPFGNGHLMPWGSLREPATSLRRAHVVWQHFHSAPMLDEPPWWPSLCAQAERVVSQACPTAAETVEGEPIALGGRRVLAASGIAQFERFVTSLGTLGAEVVAKRRFRDHYRFGPGDVAALNAAAASARVDAVVVTPKDAVKLEAIWKGPVLIVVGTKVEILIGKERLAQRLRLPSSCL